MTDVIHEDVPARHQVKSDDGGRAREWTREDVLKLIAEWRKTSSSPHNDEARQSSIHG